MSYPDNRLSGLGLSDQALVIYRRKFNSFDLNKDGIITVQEFAAISRVFGYKMTREEICEIFGKQNIEEAHGIDFEEFVLALQRRKQKAAEWAPYREKFWEYDTANRGYITSDEAFPVLKRVLGFDMNKTESFVDLFDKNRNYRITLPEFIPFYHKVEELKQQVQNAFQEFDLNCDGYIDCQEASAVLRSKGFTPDQIDAVFQRYDEDNDGSWNYSEFAAFWDVQIF